MVYPYKFFLQIWCYPLHPLLPQSVCFVLMFTCQRKAVSSWHHHSHVTSLVCAPVCSGWGPSCLGLQRVQENNLVWLCVGAVCKCKEPAKAHFLAKGLRLFIAALRCQRQDNWAGYFWSEQMGQSYALGRKNPAERKWKGMFFWQCCVQKELWWCGLPSFFCFGITNKALRDFLPKHFWQLHARAERH